MITNIIRFLYYILFFSTPLVIYSKTSELFEFNKMMLIYLITVFISFVWLIKKAVTKEPILRKNILIIPFIFFLVSQILSTIFSIDFHTSLFGYYGRFNGGLFSVISYLILFYIFIDIFDKKFLYRLIHTSLISSVLVIILGLPGKFGYDLFCLFFIGEFNNSCWTDQFRPAERLFSTLGQPNWLGAYLSVLFFIGLFFIFGGKHFVKEKRNILKFFLLYLYIFLNFTAILFTRSESAIGATFAGFTIFLILFYKYALNKVQHLNTEVKKLAILIIGLILISLIFKTGNQSIDKYLSLQNYLKISKISSIKSQVKPKVESNKFNINIVTDSFDIRKIVWKGAIGLGINSPILGNGVETFAYAYYFKRPVEHNLTSEWDFLYNKAHNEFLNYFATGGGFALLTYLAIILTVLFMIFKNISSKKDHQSVNYFDSSRSYRVFLIAILCAYISILITNFFGFSTTSINLFFYIIPAIVIAFHTNDFSNKRSIEKISFKKDKKQTFTLVVIILTFIFLLTFLIKYYAADMIYAKSETHYKSGDYQKASALLSQALSLHYEHVYEDKLSYYLANLSYMVYYQKDKKNAKTIMDLSDYYNLKSMKSSPYNVSYWKTRAKNQYLFYQATLEADNLKKGIEALNQAKKLAPTDPKISYSLALYYTLLEEDEKSKNKDNIYQKLSLKEVNEAIKLKSNFEDAYFLKGQLLKKYGRNEEAQQVFQFIIQNINPQNEDVIKELEN